MYCVICKPHLIFRVVSSFHNHHYPILKSHVCSCGIVKILADCSNCAAGVHFTMLLHAARASRGLIAVARAKVSLASPCRFICVAVHAGVLRLSFVCAQVVRSQSGTTHNGTQILLQEQLRWTQQQFQQQQQQFQQQFQQQQMQLGKVIEERQDLSKKWEGACYAIPDLKNKLEHANVEMLKLKCALNARGALRGRHFLNICR